MLILTGFEIVRFDLEKRIFKKSPGFCVTLKLSLNDKEWDSPGSHGHRKMR
jgi:hypothetical protein